MIPLARALPGVLILLLLLALGPGCKPQGGGGVSGSVPFTPSGGPQFHDSTLIIHESSITVAALTASSAVIRWETNLPATSTVEYGETERYTNSTSEEPTLKLRHSRDLHGLKYNKRYHFRCVSTDAYRNLAMSRDFVFTTMEQNFPPAAVTLAEATDIAHDAVTLAWTPSEERDFQDYVVRYDTKPEVTMDSWLPPGGVIKEKLRTSLRVTGLSSETAYHFRVFVRDTFEVSTGSNTVAAVTPVKYGPPEAVAFLPAAPVGTRNLTLNWTKFTGRGFMDYRVYKSTSPGFKPGLSAEVTIMDIDRTSWEDTGLTPGVTYYYKVFVRNQGGYTTGSAEGAFRTATIGERLYTVPNVYSPYDIVPVKTEFFIAGYDALRVFSPAEKAVVAEIAAPGYNGPVARTADEERIYTVTPTYEMLRVVDTTRRRVIDETRIPGRPQSVALARGEGQLYIPSRDEHRLYVLDRTSLRTQAIVQTGLYPVHCAAAINQTRLVVANGGTTSVSIIRTDTLADSGEVTVGSAPHRVIADTGGRAMYVLNRGDGTVSRLDLDSGAVVDTVTVGAEPVAMAFADDGKTLYLLCHGEDAVRIYDMPAFTQRGSFQVGPKPTAIALSRDEKTLYCVNYGDDTLTAHQVE